MSDISSGNEIHERATVNRYAPLRIDESERVQAQVMNSLPTAERDKIIEEVHGVSKPIEEKPGFVAEKLAALDSEIEIQKMNAYEVALKQNRSYVEDPDFRLMFLRCEGFVPRAATKRMMKYLMLKLNYFGEERITKDINFLDLSEEDVRSLESGAIQVLSEKDRSGRAVVVVFPRMWEEERTPKNVMRASYLLEMSLVRDPDVQKRGVVYIYHDTRPKRGDLGAPDAAMVSMAKNHKASMPLRYAAYHVCLRDRSGYHSIGHAICKEEDIVKGISHYGDDKECQLKLQGFGIPVSSFPVSSEGLMNFDAHREWVQRQKDSVTEITHGSTEDRNETKSSGVASLPTQQLEDQQDDTMELTDGDDSVQLEIMEPGTPERNSKSVVDPVAKAAEMAPMSVIQPPTEIDVIFGRGRWFQYYPGNISFRELLDERNAEYNAADRTEKVNMTKSIVSQLKASGRRFLKLDQNESGDKIWIEVDDKEIYKKISQCYRTVRKRDKK